MNITRYPEAFGSYRYRLTAALRDPDHQPNNGHLVVVMFNPATIHEEQDLIVKPTGTRRRLINLATSGHYHTLSEVNLFAYRSPKNTTLATEIREHRVDPVGPENDHAIAEAIHQADKLIVAWGKIPRRPIFTERVAKVTRLLQQSGKPLYCLGKNKDGSPTQPLYIQHVIQPWP